MSGEWDSFALRCSGEWEGRQRLHDGSGKTIPVPDWLAPEEFLQWNIPFNDLITQLSVKVETDGMKGRLFRQVPQVGCQSDMVHVHSKEPFRTEAADLSAFPCGSYVRRVSTVVDANNRTICGPYKVPSDVNLHGLELCLTKQHYDADVESFNQAGRRQRTRVLCIYDEASDKPLYVLYTLEKWASEHNDGQSLVACASAAAVADLPNATSTRETFHQWEELTGSATDGATNSSLEAGQTIHMPHGSHLHISDTGVVTLAWDAAEGERRTISAKNANSVEALLKKYKH